MAALYRGLKDVNNDAMPLVQEYMVRKHLAKIGVDTATMPWAKALQLAEVAVKIEEMKAGEMKKKQPKRR